MAYPEVFQKHAWTLMALILCMLESWPDVFLLKPMKSIYNLIFLLSKTMKDYEILSLTD